MNQLLAIPRSRLRCRSPRSVGLVSSLIAIGVVGCGDHPLAPTSCGPLPQVTVTVGETSSVAACFNDANGDALSFVATSANPSVATASLAGTSITVTGVAPGNTTVTVTASDPGGLQAQSSFGVMVPNRAPEPRGAMPQLAVPAGRTATVDASQYFLEPDGEVLRYAANSSDAGVASVSVEGSTITVTAEAKGGATITVTASDPGGLSADQSFRLTVPNRPPAPLGAIGAQTIEVGQSVTLDVAGSFTDPDGDRLTYTATSSIAAVARTSVSGSAVTITAAGPGTSTVTITASDPEQASATQQVSVTVPQPNRAPHPVGSIPAQAIEVGARATVNAAQYFSDPDGDALTYSATSSNSGIGRVSVSGSTVTITGASVGSATVTVTARDPEGLTAIQQARVTVSRQPNRAPRRVGTIPSQTINAGTSFTVNASRYFSDPDGDALTYIATSSSPSVARPSVSGSTVTITAVASGSATITVTARDPGGLTATQTVRVSVGTAGAPDLTVPTVTPTSVRGSPGDTVRATFTIRNSGTVASGATTVRVMISSDANISRSDPEIGDFRLRPLAANETLTIRQGLILGNTEGTRYWGLCIDAVPGESAIGNNCSQGVRVTVGGSGAPDLEFTGGVSPRTVVVTSGTSFSIRVTLANTGGARAAATKMRTFISTDSLISTNDRETGNAFDIQPLAASGKRDLTITHTFTGSGSAYVGYCVDAVAGESDTTNNCSESFRLTVLSSSNQTAGDSAAGSFLAAKNAVLRIEPGGQTNDAGDLAIGFPIILFESRREP